MNTTTPWPTRFLPSTNGIPHTEGLPHTRIVHADGTPYLDRYDILTTPDLTIRIHHWHSSDDQHAPHDHPWPNTTLVLAGQLIEHAANDTTRHLNPGAIVTRRATDPHHIELTTPDAWTLFTIGRIQRRWGFHTPDGWVHWTDWPHTGHTIHPSA